MPGNKPASTQLNPAFSIESFALREESWAKIALYFANSGELGRGIPVNFSQVDFDGLLCSSRSRTNGMQECQEFIQQR